MPAKRGLLRFIILNSSGQDVGDCSQCECCDCPFSSAWDLRPHEVIQLTHNDDERVFSCHTIWACEQCQECTLNCASDIDFGAVARALRQEAQKRGVTYQPDITESSKGECHV